MTVILKSFEYRNVRDTATIWVEQYQDKEARVPFWRISYMYDDTRPGPYGGMCFVLKKGLKNRPRRATIEDLRADI